MISDTIVCIIHLHRYNNNLLVEYNIQCKEDQLTFINITHLDIQGEDCKNGNGMKVYVYLFHLSLNSVVTIVIRNHGSDT